ncbi:uncharacterized protein AB9X84_001753 [Acanthopagrus schlegelii]
MSHGGKVIFSTSPCTAVRRTAMEAFGLRRTQSLRSLSGAQERSWAMPVPTRWERKSVYQLVQHYQSSDDLRSVDTVEQKHQVSESFAFSRRRKLESRENHIKFENVGLRESGRRSNLSRSRSMDFLPQRASTGTKALRALFESKATLQQGYNSSPWLNAAAATGWKTGRDCPLQDWRSHNTPLKDTTNQRTAQVERGKATNGLPESYDRASRYSHVCECGHNCRQLMVVKVVVVVVVVKNKYQLHFTTICTAASGPKRPPTLLCR